VVQHVLDAAHVVTKADVAKTLPVNVVSGGEELVAQVAFGGSHELVRLPSVGGESKRFSQPGCSYLRCHLVAELDPWAAVRRFGKVPCGGQRILLVIASEKHDRGFQTLSRRTKS